MPAPRTFYFVALLLLAVTILFALFAEKSSPLFGATSELDPVSAECMSCHDGSGGIHVRFCLHGQNGMNCGGHIVSVSYSELAAQDKSLLPESSLPPEMVLYEGLLTCVTCHGDDPHTGDPLVIDNSSSDLCRGCHLK